MQALAKCECGCNELAPITRGKQKRFIQGHNSRVLSNFTLRNQTEKNNFRWLGDNANSNGIHTWLRKNFVKTGICENCDTEGKTDYAFKFHPKKHTRNINDYKELCRKCHIKYDQPPGLVVGPLVNA
jgi:hypothetical protein